MPILGRIFSLSAGTSLSFPFLSRRGDFEPMSTIGKPCFVHTSPNEAEQGSLSWAPFSMGLRWGHITHALPAY